jgi:methionyl-tRNA formyltransferase
MQMEAGLDTGPMLKMRTMAIGSLDTSQTMHDKLSLLGAEMIVGVLDELEAGTLHAVAQDDAGATYAPLMKKEDGILDLGAPATRVVSRIHGLNPWPGAQINLLQQGKDPLPIKLLLAQPVATPHNSAPGTLLEHGKRLIIACGEGAIEVLELQPTGKRPMAARDFLNGVRLADSDTFG